MTKKAQRHPVIAGDETVLQASYGLNASVVKLANRAVGAPRTKAWSEDMGSTEGMAAPFRKSGVVALTGKRLIFFRKRFAIGAPKHVEAEWPLDQVADISYDADDSILLVVFEDGSSGGLHSPKNQSPHKLAAAFADLRRRAQSP